MLPDFLIIGAAKSGTTWLVHCLDSNSRVFIPQTELHFFSRYADDLESHREWYEQHFEGSHDGQIIGENSNYLSNPHAAKLIHDWLPDVRLITLLRNPTERAYSAYCMQLRKGRVTVDINAYLDPAISEAPHIITNGCYHKHLSRFIDYFPQERMHYVIFDDIGFDPKNVYVGVCRFLGIPEIFDTELLTQRVNAKDGVFLPPGINKLMSRFGWTARPRALLSGTLFQRIVRSMLARSFTYPEFSEQSRTKLNEYYAEDVAKLSELVGRDLSFWLS